LLGGRIAGLVLIGPGAEAPSLALARDDIAAWRQAVGSIRVSHHRHERF